MKQDVREGGKGVEYLNCWTTKATWNFHSIPLLEMGTSKQVFSPVFSSLL